MLKTNNSDPTTITGFQDGRIGVSYRILIGDDNTTFDFSSPGTTLHGNGGQDWAPVTNDHLTCVFDGTRWFCDVSDNTPP